MSESKIILRLKVGEGEIQLEGSRQAILEMLEKDLPKIVESFSRVTVERTGTYPPAPGTETAAEPSPPTVSSRLEEAEPYPSVRAKSCADAITTLLSTAWGKRKPRTLSDIKEALEANALHYSGKVIGFTLTRLTRRQKLRRWKSEEGFVYTLGA